MVLHLARPSGEFIPEILFYKKSFFQALRWQTLDGWPPQTRRLLVRRHPPWNKHITPAPSPSMFRGQPHRHTSQLPPCEQSHTEELRL